MESGDGGMYKDAREREREKPALPDVSEDRWMREKRGSPEDMVNKEGWESLTPLLAACPGTNCRWPLYWWIDAFIVGLVSRFGQLQGFHADGVCINPKLE